MNRDRVAYLSMEEQKYLFKAYSTHARSQAITREAGLHGCLEHTSVKVPTKKRNGREKLQARILLC